MPNLIAHLGVGGVATGALLRAADPKWIFVGCVIPDIPWILQRFVHAFGEGVDPYEMRLYVIAQSSLACCLILAAALATVSEAPQRVFCILALNVLIHLLLDACQTKWASGVLLYAPLSWRPLTMDLFWPESIATYLLSGFGLLYFVAVWRRGGANEVKVTVRPASRALFCVTFVTAYLWLPWALRDGPEKADNHYVKTLRQRDTRTGRYVELDRTRLTREGGIGFVELIDGERIRVVGELPLASGVVSIHGVFIDTTTISIGHFHQHHAGVRDLASIVGLVLVGLYWCNSGNLRPLIRRTSRT